MKRLTFKILSVISLFSLLLSLFVTLPSRAQSSGISLDFAGAEPLTYNHQTGGGKWNSGVVNTDIERSLEGEDFACRDKVSYLAKIDVANTQDLIDLGAMTLRLNFHFDLDTTGQSGVALAKPITASINSASDTATRGDANSTVVEVSTSETGPKFSKGAELYATYDVTDVEANETIVLRIDITLDCQAGASPTGNLQANLDDGSIIKKLGNVAVVPAIVVASGARTIDLKSVNKVANPELVIAKTVTFPELSCPGGESVLIEPDQSVKYCYRVTNPSNAGGKTGATVYNLSVINDDSGEYPDFTVPLTSGLTDIDGDGQVDDLAPGAVALAEKVIAFDGDKDTVLTNIATITGTDAPIGGNTLSASDTAVVNIDAPDLVPSIDIQKTPDSQTVFDGLTATFTITVTNTGNVDLTNVVVTDPATPSCDKTFATLAIGATETYSCTTVALLASFTNTATVTGNYDTTQVTDDDSAVVTVDFRPNIEVVKTASVASVPETGGSVDFSVVVKNKAVENFTLNSLIDDKFGDLNGVGTCTVPQTIAAAGEYSCTFTKFLASDSLTAHTNTVTASGQDPEGNQASANDNETVTFIDVKPDITLSKGVDPTMVLYTGGNVNYKFRVTNLSLEPVTISSFTDNKITLSAECAALVGYVLAPTSYVECSTNNYFLSSPTDETFVNTATAVGTDNEGNTDSAEASATVTFARPSIDIQKTPDTQTIDEGLTATFQIAVSNTGNVPLTNITVTDAATPSCDKTFASLAVGATETYSCTTLALLASFTNVAAVSAMYGTTQVTDEDSAAIVLDYMPKIEVVKSASTSSIPETGGAVTFTVVVKNKAVENFILNSLVDDKFGNLAGVGSCAVPQTIAAAGEYSCSFTKTLSGEALASHTNIVTASGQDPEGNQTSANDNETVTFTDVKPDISLTKTVDPTAARWTGDYVNYRFRISNLTAEAVTITSFVDNAITLSPACSALVGYVLAPLAYVECATNNYYLTGLPGGSFTNTATAVARDNEGNTDTANASAVVTFWWYGRTPGYWKNHAEAWTSGYTPSMNIQDLFVIPAGLIKDGKLDLDKNNIKDTLMAGLAYKGGNNLTGAAQILFRAAIAALLNEAYYGADYPGATSTSALITKVNEVLATNARAQYLALASYYDYWNNAVHASLP